MKDNRKYARIFSTEQTSCLGGNNRCEHCDETMTPPMLIGMIARMQGNIMRNSETESPIMSQNSCRMLLRELARKDNVSQLYLARHTGLKPPTVSVAVGKLEAAGYVRREVSEFDARECRVFLTDSGHALEESTRARIRATDEFAMRGFSDDEIETLRVLLLRIKRTLESNENAHDPHV